MRELNLRDGVKKTSDVCLTSDVLILFQDLEQVSPHRAVGSALTDNGLWLPDNFKIYCRHQITAHINLQIHLGRHTISIINGNTILTGF